ncbi:MAG: PilW family protein [Pseudomonadota bacterium]|nr:PilW family protein [Pseudomonadota bacterium]
MPYPATPRRPAAAQRGVTLIELMVGIAIGLLVVAVATAALMVSRGVSGTVSDASGIQQQAAYAMRTIGMQLRQAGSLALNLNPTNAHADNMAAAPVAFESTTAQFDPRQNTVAGTAANELTVGYRRNPEPVFTSATPVSFSRNCVGGPGDLSTTTIIESVFQLDGSNLMCRGNNAATAQPVVRNVANFQVRYLVQDNFATPGSPQVRYFAAGAVTNWANVQGVEVCLVLYGDEPVTMPAGTSYTDCDGTSTVDMSTLTGPRARRMHLVFRNVFQLRSQGLVGSVL